MYERTVKEIDPTLSDTEAAGVVGSMRLEYGTLNHLPRSTFRREIRLARECERDLPGYLERCARFA